MASGAWIGPTIPAQIAESLTKLIGHKHGTEGDTLNVAALWCRMAGHNLLMFIALDRC